MPSPQNPVYLEPKVILSRDCSNFIFQDLTPAYNVLTAANGYDSTGVYCVNPANITTPTLLVTNMASPTVVKTVNIPTTSPTYLSTRIPGVIQYTVTPTILGMSIGDGVYKFLYRITDSADNQVYERTCYVLVDCSISASLDQKLKDLKECGTCSDANNRTVNMLYEAYMLKEKAHHLVACHDFAGAQEVLDYLMRLLDITYCDSCNN